MRSPGGMGPDLGFARNKGLGVWRQWKNTGRAVVGLGDTVPGALRCTVGSAGCRGVPVPIGGSKGNEPPHPPSHCTAALGVQRECRIWDTWSAAWGGSRRACECVRGHEGAVRGLWGGFRSVCICNGSLEGQRGVGVAWRADEQRRGLVLLSAWEPCTEAAASSWQALYPMYHCHRDPKASPRLSFSLIPVRLRTEGRFGFVMRLLSSPSSEHTSQVPSHP